MSRESHINPEGPWSHGNPPTYESPNPEPTTMRRFIVTYGSNHVDDHGHSLMMKYSVVEAGDEIEARMKIVKVRGAKWSMLYTSEEGAGVERFKLQLVPLSRPGPFGLNAGATIEDLLQKIEDALLVHEAAQKREDCIASLKILATIYVVVFGVALTDEKQDGPGPWRLDPTPLRGSVELEHVRGLLRDFAVQQKIELP